MPEIMKIHIEALVGSSRFSVRVELADAAQLWAAGHMLLRMGDNEMVNDGVRQAKEELLTPALIVPKRMA